ncbi:MAG: GntR family transcriptional regulator [Pseudomonadota bacterium]
MTRPDFRSWQSVHDEVLRRIQTRAWKPGEMIPHEADLAAEFGCARATVNRALRQIAQTGLLDRRRKAGTRVAEHPVAKATLDIAVIRQDVEARGQCYRHQLIARRIERPPGAISAAMRTDVPQRLLHLCAVHMADAQPYALEDRWINLSTVPEAMGQDFAETSSNEWLLNHAPYTHGEIAFSAANASQVEADALGCGTGTAVFVLDRLTWNGAVSVTKVRLVFAAGHAMRATL